MVEGVGKRDIGIPAEEDFEKIDFIGYKKKNVIRKHPYDQTSSGYMLNDHLVRNVEDRRPYRSFYKCDREGNKEHGHQFFYAETKCLKTQINYVILNSEVNIMWHELVIYAHMMLMLFLHKIKK
jgi:hypothetical protein